MRVAELHLRAFGHFTDVRVDLDSDGPALHVVYGHNEAGKSTTLRALSGLFFGIPARTPDAHRHPMPKRCQRVRVVVDPPWKVAHGILDQPYVIPRVGFLNAHAAIVEHSIQKWKRSESQ